MRLLAIAFIVAFAAGGAGAQDAEDVERREEPHNPDGQVVLFGGLDKVTARTAEFDGKVGETATFGTLEIVIRRCQKSPPDQQRPERGAFLEIYDVHSKDGSPARKRIFSGWMFASSPALSALDHPIYDVWVKDCK